TTNPGPEPAPPPPLKPAPLPACSGKFVLKEKQPAAELVSKQTLLTNLLYRNDVFAYISNGFCRSESTWFLDAFVTTRAYHDDTKEYEVTVALEGGCANCAPYFVLDGTSYIKAAARVRTSWGGIDAASTAKAQASTVWTGLLACSDGAEARITDCQTGGELKLAMAGLEFVARESRSDATETSTAGKGDHKDSRDNSVTMKVTNNATVHTDASGTENNSQAKALVGETMKIAATTKCGATATYELTRICR
ncbi:MAG: hypothetical protein HUU06_10545, partial [Planctomycetaceae bacterium]|nr:hypothetical protein [Planctomycetaceae bacterium]